MSLRRLFQSAWPRIMSRHWGAKIKDQDGVRKDTGVNPAMEEMAAILASEAPIAINGPITILNRTNGPAINIINQGPVDQTQGIHIENEAGQVTELGLGLSSRNILANAYIPLASADIDPLKAWLFYGKNESLAYRDLENLGRDAPPESPGKESGQIDPGYQYQQGQQIEPGGSYGGGGGNSTDNRSLSFNFHKIVNVNKVFQGGEGVSDTLTVVTDVECDGSDLTVTYGTWTFTKGILVDVS